MKIKPNWIVIAVLGGIVILLLMTRECGQWKEKGDTVTVTDTVIVPGDPYPVYTAPRVPKPERIIEYQVVPQKVDTAAILKDYFATRFYPDTLKNDTSMFIAVHDSVRENRIVSRRFIFQNKRPISIVSNTTVTHNKKEPWFKLYLGLNASYAPGSKRFGFGPFATGTVKQGALLTYGYDAVGNSHQVGFGWKLSFRKR